MRRNEIIRFLKDHGFWLRRDGRKHSLWTNDKGASISVGHGAKIEDRLSRCIMIQARKGESGAPSGNLTYATRTYKLVHP